MADKKERKSLITPRGILCFPSLFKPSAYEEGREPDFQMLLVMEKDKVRDDPAWKALRTAVVEAARAKFGDKAAAMMKAGKLRMPWRPGEDYETYGDPFNSKTVMIKLKSNTKPGLVTHDLEPITDEDELYAGCYVRASYAPYAYDQKGGKGVTLLLNNVQKLGNGKRLSGRRPARDEFEAVEAEDVVSDIDGGGDEDDLFN